MDAVPRGQLVTLEADVDRQLSAEHEHHLGAGMPVAPGARLASRLVDELEEVDVGQRLGREPLPSNPALGFDGRASIAPDHVAPSGGRLAVASPIGVARIRQTLGLRSLSAGRLVLGEERVDRQFQDLSQREQRRDGGL